MPNFIGSPPNCRPECVVSSECPANLACVEKKCSNPCLTACGVNANCNVINHSPICVCKQGLTGNPFTTCYPQIGKSTFFNDHVDIYNCLLLYLLKYVHIMLLLLLFISINMEHIDVIQLMLYDI